MDIKAKFYRTYIVRVKTPKGVFWYGGKHESNHLNPYDDKYPGSGTRLWNIYKKYGLKYKIRWFKNHANIKKCFEHERALIRKLREKHGLYYCINIADGGVGGEGFSWSNEQKLAQKLRLNEPETKAKMSKSQKVAQNRSSRRERQSEVMNKFYKNGGSKKVSESTSKAQRTALHWHEPLKSEIYNLWVSLGRPKQGAVAKALKGKYECTGSSIKLLIYEFRNNMSYEEQIAAYEDEQLEDNK